MKLKFDEPLSNFAFNFNLRRYISVEDVREKLDAYLDVVEGSRIVSRK